MKTKTASLINRFLIPVLAVSGLTLGFVPREFSLESLISGQAGGQRIAGEETESAETQALSVPGLAVAKFESSSGEGYSLAELFRINGEYVRKWDLIVWKSGNFRLADGIVRQENVKHHGLSTYALGTDAVTSRIIRDHSIWSADLGAGSVTSEAIDNGSVSSDDLAERISVRYLSVGNTLSFGRISSGVWNGSVIDSDYLDFSGIAGTDISIFTNDAGYITASTSDTLTNKSGLVSMWTNDAGYITAASFAGTAGYVAKFSGSGTAVNSLIFESGSMIGIGTSNPANPLDIGIGGGIRLAAGVPGTTDMALYNDSGTLIWNGMALGTSSASVSGTAGYIGKFTGVNSIANSAIYETGGSVGIGTTSPGAKLEVSGGVIASAFNGNAIATGTGMLSLGSYSLYVTGNAYVNQNLRTIDAPAFAGLTLTGALAAANGGTGLSSYDEGDILYYSSGSTLSRLAAGTDGQVLVMNGGIPAWQDTATGASHDLLSASHDDTTAATVQRGDIVTGQGSSAATWSRLAAGGVGQLLSIDSNGDVFWKSVSVGDGIGVTEDSLDFSELKDTMTLDADLNVWSSTNDYSINFDSGTLFLDTANDRVGIGTTSPGAKLDVAGTGRFAGQLASTVTTGTAPFSIASTTLVSNLNVQYLNGKAGSYYAAASSISGTNGYLARFTADGAVGNSSMYTDGTRVGIGTTGYLNGALHIESSGSNGIYIRKAAGALYKGLYIMDDSGSSEGIEYAANVEMFNITGSLSDYRAGLRIHVDPGNTTPTANRLFGMVIGAHAPNAQGIYILADGASSSVMSSYAAGSYGTQMITGNGNGTSSTVSEFILHRSTGTMLDLYHSSSVMAGNAISVNVEADGTGSFQGNYLVLSKEYVPKLYIDKDANVVTSGVVNPAGGVVLGNSVPLLMGAGSPSALYYDGTNTVLNLRISGSGNLLLPSGNVGIGTTAPEYSLDVAGSIRASGQLISSVATGTAPFSIASTTLVSNLNAQYLNGQLGSYYAAASSVSGTSGYLAKFTGSGTVGNSPVYVSGTSVGIGTTAPEYSLDVAGTGRFTGLLTGQAGLTVTGGAVNLNASSNYAVNVATGTSTGAVTIGGGSNAVSIDSSDWDISTAGVMTGISGITSNGSYIQSGTSANAFTGTSTFSNATYSALFTGGNVGIGTTAPAGKLGISNYGANVPAIYINKAAGVLNKAIYVVDNSGSNNGLEYDLNLEMSGITGSLSDYRAGMRIHLDPSINVDTADKLYGIVLGVHGNNSNGIYILADGTNSKGITTYADGTVGNLMITGSGSGTESTGAYQIIHRTTGKVLEITHSSSSMSSNVIEIDMEADGTGNFTGNFLTFTTDSYAPKFIVDSNGSLTSVGSVTAYSGYFAPDNVAYWMGTGNDAALYYDGSNVTLNTRVSGTGNFIVSGGGNVGIGTNSPSAQLHTTGTVRFANFGAGTVSTDSSGNITVSSDERLKDIDSYFTRGLSAIMGIDPISYHWNKKSGLETDDQYSGFSAQNIRSVIPEAVGEDNRGYLTLSDRPILAAAVNAVKEQQGLINGLDVRTDANVSDLGSLEESVNGTFMTLSQAIESNRSRTEAVEKSLADYAAVVESLKTGLSANAEQQLALESLAGEIKDEQERQKLAMDTRTVLMGRNLNAISGRIDSLSRQLIAGNFDADATFKEFDYADLSGSGDADSDLESAGCEDGSYAGTYDGSGEFREIRIKRDDGLDLSGYKISNGYLEFDVYMSDADAIRDFMTEFGNGIDSDELRWDRSLHPYFLTGWNHVRLPVSSARETGTVDWSDLDHFRIYFKSAAKERIAIRNVKIGVEELYVPADSDKLALDGKTYDLSSEDGKASAIKAISAKLATAAAEAAKVDDLADEVGSLKGRVSDLESLTKTMADLADVLDPDNMVYKDEDGNLDLGEGLLSVKTLNVAGTIEADKIKADSGEMKDLQTGTIEVGEDSSGKGTIQSGDTEVKIKTTQASKEAKIYVTASGSTQGKELYYDEVSDGESFKVKFDGDSVDKDIDFDWLIIK